MVDVTDNKVKIAVLQEELDALEKAEGLQPKVKAKAAIEMHQRLKQIRETMKDETLETKAEFIAVAQSLIDVLLPEEAKGTNETESS